MGNGGEQVWVLGPHGDVVSALWEVGANLEALIQGEEQLQLSSADRKDVWNNGLRVGSMLSWTYEEETARDELEGLFASFASKGLRVCHLLAPHGRNVCLTDFEGQEKNVQPEFVSVPLLMHHDNSLQHAEIALKAHLARSLDTARAPEFIQAFWGKELQFKKALRQVTWGVAEVEAWWEFMSQYLSCFGTPNSTSIKGGFQTAASFSRDDLGREASALSLLASSLPPQHRDLERLTKLTLAKGFNNARLEALKSQADASQLWSLCGLEFDFASAILTSKTRHEQVSHEVLLSLPSAQRQEIMDAAWNKWQETTWPLVVTIDAPVWQALHAKESQWPHWSALLDRAVSLGASAPIRALLVEQRQAVLDAAWDSPTPASVPKVRM